MLNSNTTRNKEKCNVYGLFTGVIALLAAAAGTAVGCYYAFKTAEALKYVQTGSIEDTQDNENARAVLTVVGIFLVPLTAAIFGCSLCVCICAVNAYYEYNDKYNLNRLFSKAPDNFNSRRLEPRESGVELTQTQARLP